MIWKHPEKNINKNEHMSLFVWSVSLALLVLVNYWIVLYGCIFSIFWINTYFSDTLHFCILHNISGGISLCFYKEKAADVSHGQQCCLCWLCNIIENDFVSLFLCSLVHLIVAYILYFLADMDFHFTYLMVSIWVWENASLSAVSTQTNKALPFTKMTHISLSSFSITLATIQGREALISPLYLESSSVLSEHPLWCVFRWSFLEGCSNGNMQE